MSSKVLARIGVFSAVYALLTILPPFNAAGYGPVQIRVSEALAVFPFFFPWAPWGLYLGCILANLGSPFIMWDITLGAGASLVAGLLTRRMPRLCLAPLPPIIVNAFVVPIYVAPLTGMPYWTVVLYIAAGEAVACYGLGYPLLLYLRRNERARELISGSLP